MLKQCEFLLHNAKELIATKAGCRSSHSTPVRCGHYYIDRYIKFCASNEPFAARCYWGAEGLGILGVFGIPLPGRAVPEVRRPSIRGGI